MTLVLTLVDSALSKGSEITATIRLDNSFKPVDNNILPFMYNKKRSKYQRVYP